MNISACWDDKEFQIPDILFDEILVMCQKEQFYASLVDIYARENASKIYQTWNNS